MIVLCASLLVPGYAIAQTPKTPTVNRRLDALEAALKDQRRTIEQLRTKLKEGDGEEKEALALDLRDELEDYKEKISKFVSISGYFDFEYGDSNRGSKSDSFRQHHLSIFLSKHIGDFSLFSEIEFEDATNLKGNGDGTFNDSNGEVKVESAWAQWERYDWLKIRAGQLIIPHWYHLNHFPYLTNSTTRPNFIRRIVPFQTNGVMALGRLNFKSLDSGGFGGAGASYYLYTGNGRGPNQGKQDNDTSKATGARIILHLPKPSRIRTFNLGFGGYAERDNSKALNERELIRSVDLVVEVHVTKILAIGLRAEYEYGRIKVKGGGSNNRFKEGGYVEPYMNLNISGYEFVLWGRHERTDLDNTKRGPLDGSRDFIGLNFFPIPQVVLKTEYFHERNEDPTRSNADVWTLAFVLHF